MADVLTRKQRSFNMSMIKGKNTSPETMLRRLLRARGVNGYRCHYDIVGKPDIAFVKAKVAVFIDGCFWHKCPRCYRDPQTNKTFWKDKINANALRDKKVNKILAEKGWRVIRVWEHGLKRDAERVCSKIISVID